MYQAIPYRVHTTSIFFQIKFPRYDSERLLASRESEGCCHIQHGLNLTGNGEVGMTSDYPVTVTLTTNCNGSQMLFVVGMPSLLPSLKILKQISIKQNNLVVFIKSTQLCNFPQACARNVCMFYIKHEDNWILGIIQNLFSLEHIPFLQVFCWNRKVSSQGVPTFLCYLANVGRTLNRILC